MTIVNATRNNTDELLNLYSSMVGGACEWNEYYPNIDNINFDLNNNNLFIMKDNNNRIAAAISIDYDMDVEKLDCWSKSPDMIPSAELSRLCVRKDLQNKGIAREMMNYSFDILRKRGYKAVHILVKKGHVVALNSYSHLNYKTVGTCTLFEKEFICMERKL